MERSSNLEAGGKPLEKLNGESTLGKELGWSKPEAPRTFDQHVNDTIANVTSRVEESIVTNEMILKLSSIYQQLLSGHTLTMDEATWMYFVCQAFLQENVKQREKIKEVMSLWIKDQFDRNKPSLSRYAL